MSDNGDRRKEARKTIVNFTLVYDSKSENLLGYLRDLTLNGLQISGSKKLDAGTEISLSFELPDALAGMGAKQMRVVAKVARCITITEEPVGYEIGFQFIDLGIEEKEVIENFLKRYHFKRELH